MLANQLMLNGAVMIETAKTSAVAFIKARKSLDVWWREKKFICKKKKIEGVSEKSKVVYGGMDFMKKEWYTSKSGFHEEVMIY